jgi:hypothetical protein
MPQHSVPAVRQKLHLSSCADLENQLSHCFSRVDKIHLHIAARHAIPQLYECGHARMKNRRFLTKQIAAIAAKEDERSKSLPAFQKIEMIAS